MNFNLKQHPSIDITNKKFKQQQTIGADEQLVSYIQKVKPGLFQ